MLRIPFSGQMGLVCLLGVSSLGAQTVSFIAAQAFSAGNSPKSVAGGDYNGDGLRDLAVADTGTSSVAILLGNGDGTFQSPVAYPAEAAPALW